MRLFVQTRAVNATGTGTDTGGVTDDQRRSIQKRTVVTLLFSQASGGVGLVSTYIVTALLALDMTGSKVLATISAALLSVGAAAASYPLAKLMETHGRRVGLRFAYLMGVAGAGVALLGAVTRQYIILSIGVFGAGAGSAANLATRYAASDLAPEHQRARAISLIVWATTIGSTTGAIVSGLASDVGEWLGLPDKAGAYLFGGLMFLVAAAIVELKLRPDPLDIARRLGGGAATATASHKQPARESIRLILANPAARLAVGAMVVSQVTMLGVMSLTPLHMDEGGQTQSMIGWMMAFHIWGMYLFSPIVGVLTDRIGQYPMLYMSGILCTWGAAWAAITPPEGALGVFMGNFLIGLGWSFGVVAASSLIVAEFPIEQRVGVQGIGDLAMIGSGAIAGVLSGALYTLFGYSGVNAGNAAFGVLLVAATAVTYMLIRRRREEPAPVAIS